MGGGGSAGTVDFPVHMKDIHQDWLGYSGGVDAISVDMISVMDNALGMSGNPFDGISLTDPNTDLAAVETEHAEFDTSVDALDAETDWDGLVDNAVATIDTEGVLNDLDVASIADAARTEADNELTKAIAKAVDSLSDSVIAKLMEAFQRRLGKARRTAVNRFSAQMSDINSVNSSAFLIGIALIESEYIEKTADFQAQVEGRLYEKAFDAHVTIYRDYLARSLEAEVREKAARDTLLVNSVQVQAQMFQNQLVLEKEVASLLLEIKRIRTVATQEYELGNADLNYRFAKWDFEVFTQGSNILSSINGSAAVLPDSPSKTASALGGALSGAAAGAALGPIGAGVGAAVGLTAGLLQ